jgi:hypothetical protein
MARLRSAAASGLDLTKNNLIPDYNLGVAGRVTDPLALRLPLQWAALPTPLLAVGWF